MCGVGRRGLPGAAAAAAGPLSNAGASVLSATRLAARAATSAVSSLRACRRRRHQARDRRIRLAFQVRAQQYVCSSVASSA